MGGIGKTEVTLQYALKNSHAYPGGICWIYANRQDIASQIIQFSRIGLQLNPSEELTPEEQVRFCWSHWPFKNALIIFDDAPSYESIKLFLPPNEPRFRTILISRSLLGGSIKHIPLEVLEEESALNLLASFISQERVQKEISIAKQICSWLGYLPLGLELIGRYLARRSELSLTTLQQRLEEDKLSARAITKFEQDMTKPTSIYSAFELSWVELSNQGDQVTALAYALGLFALAPIPWQLIEHCLFRWDIEELEDIREEFLLSFHLLYRNGNGKYQLHQLIREFFRQKNHEVVQSEEMQRIVANRLALFSKQIPESLTYELLLNFEPVIPHIVEVTKNLVDYLDDENFIYPFQALGRYYEGQGFYRQVEAIHEECRHLSKKNFGDRHGNTAKSLDNLASIYYFQGKYEEAEMLQREALSIQESLSGREHLSVADTLNNLALTLQEKGDYVEAEELYIRSMSIRSNFLGKEHPDFTDSLNNLAMLYNDQGYYVKAEELLLEALARRKKVLGSSHPRVATSLNNLASCYYHQNRFEEAKRLYSEALSLYRCLHQRDHRDIAIALSNLAQVCSKQGEYSSAEPLLQESLNIQEVIFGHEHPEIAITLNNLASLYEDEGKTNEAEVSYRKALSMKRKLLGSDSVDVAISLNNLAKFCHNHKNYSEAKSLYIESLAILKRKLELDHPLINIISANFRGCFKSRLGSKKAPSVISCT